MLILFVCWGSWNNENNGYTQLNNLIIAAPDSDPMINSPNDLHGYNPGSAVIKLI